MISFSASRAASRSTGPACRPGRSVIGASPLSTFFWIALGQPPGGCPRSPRIMPTTLSGKDTSTAGSSTCARLNPCETIIRAMSPTTLEEGVTFTMSPNIRFTSA